MAQVSQVPAAFQSASLYVGDLANDITENVLFDLFSKLGPVASIRVCRDSITRRSLGYAYVNFHNVQDAERALDTMNFTDIAGRACRIMWSQRDPSLRKTGLGNVYVKNLAPSVDHKGLYDTFSVFGNILSCKVIQDQKGDSKGYGYVHFETAEAAQDAISKLDGMLIDDVKVSVAHFVRRQDRAASNKWTNLYVKHFPRSWTEEQFKAQFSPFGVVQSAILTTGEDGKNKGFGFVNFESHESAVKAVEALNGKTIEGDGITLSFYVGKAQKKGEREREMKARQENIKLERINKYQNMNLYVKNISDTVTDEQFKEAFALFGAISSARVMRDDSKASKGFGFVCFSNPEDAAKAVAEMNNKMLAGKPLVVTFYQRQEMRRQQMAASFAPPMARFGAPIPPFPAMYGQPSFPPANAGVSAVAGNPRGMPFFNPAAVPRGFPAGGRGQGQFVPPQYVPQGQVPQGYAPRGRPQNAMPRGAPRPPFAPFPQQGVPANVAGVPPQQQAPRGNVRFTAQARNQGPAAVPVAAPSASQPASQQKMDFSEALLATADPVQQKNMIGEKLYPLIYHSQPELAGKITGMLLEMDNAELINLIESPDALASKIDEALAVLRSHASDN